MDAKRIPLTYYDNKPYWGIVNSEDPTGIKENWWNSLNFIGVFIIAKALIHVIPHLIGYLLSVCIFYRLITCSFKKTLLLILIYWIVGISLYIIYFNYILWIGAFVTIIHFGTGIIIFRYAFGLRYKKSIIYTFIMSLVYGLSCFGIHVYWLSS